MWMLCSIFCPKMPEIPSRDSENWEYCSFLKKYQPSYSLEWQLKSSTHTKQCKVPVCLLYKAAIRSWKSEQINRGSMLNSTTASSNTFPAQSDSLLNKGYSKFQSSQYPSCSCFKWKACNDFSAIRYLWLVEDPSPSSLTQHGCMKRQAQH